MQLKLVNLLTHAATAFVVLAVGTVLSAGAAYYTARQTEQDASEKFERVVAEARDAIETRIRAYSDVLLGVKALFIASDSVTRDEFQTYVASLDLNRRYSGIRLISYAQRVPAGQVRAFEEIVRNDRSVDPRGYPDFAVKPAGDRPEYFVVQYVEPMAGNEASLGLDLGSEAVRRASLERARDSGQLTASGTIALVLGTERQPGFAMRLPVYRKGMPVVTEAQRREAFAGMVNATFVTIDLMRGVLGEHFLHTMRVRIYDAGALDGPRGPQQPAPENLMFDSDRLLPAVSPPDRSGDSGGADLTGTASLDVGGRGWKLHFKARQGFIEPFERLLPWATFLAGALISLLLFGMIRSLATSGRRAIYLAERITQDLRKSEAQFQATFDQAAVGIAHFDLQHRNIKANRRYGGIVGYTPDELLGKPPGFLNHPDDVGMGSEQRSQLLTGAIDHFSQDKRYLRKDGTVIWVRRTESLARDGAGAPQYYIRVIEDITERKQAEERYRATFDNAPVGIMHTAIDGDRILHANSKLCEMLGYTHDELVSMNTDQFIHPEHVGVDQPKYRETMLKGEIDTFSSERLYRRKDGSDFWVNRTVSLVKDAAGKPLYFIRVIEDIGERKRAEQAVTSERALLRTIIDTVPDYIYVKDAQGRFQLANKAWLKERKSDSEEIVGKTVFDVFSPPELARRMAEQDAAVVESGVPMLDREQLVALKGPDGNPGRIQWAAITKVPMRDASGNIIGTVGISRDITEHKLSARRREMEHAVTRMLAESGTLDTAMKRILQIICEGLEWACGAYWQRDETAELLRCVETWCINAEGVAEFVAASRGGTNEAPAWHGGSPPGTRTGGLVRNIWQSGAPVWFPDVTQRPDFRRGIAATKADLHSAFGFPILAGEKPLGVMEFYSRDIKEPDEALLQIVGAIGSQIGQYIVRQQAEERVRRLAHYDELTGLPNRTMFNERLSHALAHARRTERSLAILFIDLDRFKNINDTLGHEAGDRVLKEVADRLRVCLRESDTVGRLGGDEFVVLIEEPPRPANAAVVAQKILAAMGTPFLVQAQEFHITASIGISSYPDDGADMQTLMKNADIAMYRAKEQGKNNFQFYSAQINVHSIERFTLESSLRRALERNEFLLHYQPKLDIASGRITGVEALLRWQKPVQGLIPPAQFIQLAEETGLIVPIGEWVLKTACAQNKAWQLEGWAPVRIAVNLSPRQFAHENLLEDVARVLKQTGLDPAFLELEITESVVMRNPEQAVILLNRLKAFGIHLSIDDFGTGYSSLNYLKRFPLDTLKIDRTFIKDLPGDGDDAAITQAIIAMAHSLRLSVVAEGVETAEQLGFLREYKCDEIQGYYFSRPQPESGIAPLLRNNATLGKVRSLR